MGFYIETEHNLLKDRQLAEKHGALYIGLPVWPPPEGKVYVCVVKNGPFDAAGIAFDLEEFLTFMRPDGRQKVWLAMDRAEVLKLNPHVEKYLNPGGPTDGR